MDKDFMLNYYDKMVRPIWTELMKTPRYQRVACEHDKLEREFRRLLDEKLGRKYLELDDALFRVMDDIAEAMYMKGAADRELMIRSYHELRLLLWAVGRTVFLLPYSESTLSGQPFPAAFHGRPNTVWHPA